MIDNFSQYINFSSQTVLWGIRLTKTALIIDDDQSILRNFSRLLEVNGYQVYAVATGKEAIDQVNQRCFELILIDFRLPDMDGTDVLEKMGDKVNDAVKIMITGFPTIEASIRALELGIDSYVEKPINPNNLISLIEEIKQRKILTKKSQ